jgi:glyoxylase-like metal-dependent hydrolase (beta-lactamase superfamily II)
MNIRAILVQTGLVLFGTVVAAHAQYNLNADLSADQTVQVGPHVWVIRGFPNVAMVVGSTGTLVVDTGLGARNGAFLAQSALNRSSKGAKLYLTTTHYHPEHASGDGGFPVGTIVIRPRIQQQELEADGQNMIDMFSKRSESNRALLEGAKVRPADVLFDGSYILDLGGDVRVRLLWFGPAHTRGDEVVMVDPDSVLVAGDVVQNKTGPQFYCSECTPKKWLQVLDQVLPLDARIVVPDHSPPGDGSLVNAERDFMRDLVGRIEVLKGQGKSLDATKSIITSEFQAKYPDWASMNRIGDAVERGYKDN